MLLKILAAVIVICCAILAVDRFIVRPQSDSATTDDLPAIAAEMDMELSPRGTHDEQIQATTRSLAEATPGIDPADTVGDVFYRAGEGYELFVYEHGDERTAVHTDTNRHTATVNRLGILIRWPAAHLPYFTAYDDGRIAAGGDERLREILTRESIERMRGFDGFTAAGGGQSLLFLADAPSSALMALAEQSTSPEFQPGLRNSALKVDVQRAVDIANLMNVSSFAVADVYTVDVGDTDIQWKKPDLTSGIDEVAAETHEKAAEIVEDFKASSAAINEEHSRQQQEILARMQERNQETLDESRKQSAAIIEEQRQRSAEILQQQRERNAEALKRSQERLEEIQRQYGIEPVQDANTEEAAPRPATDESGASKSG